MKNNMSGDHYEMISKVASGPKCSRGVGVKDCTWAPPMGSGVEFRQDMIRSR